MSNLSRSAFQGHPFHLVSPSPWPILTCASLFTLTTSGVLCMHGFSQAQYTLTSAMMLLISSMFLWFRDVVSEGTYIGNHTLAVQRGLNMGVSLFIISEALFFLAIFWAYFHSALAPTVELGAQWPPLGIEAINAFELPLLNTVLLLSSGVTITYCHHSLIQGNRYGALSGGVATILLAGVFTAFQGIEYSVSSFTLSDGTFGSCFYFGTGLTTAPIMFNNKLSPLWITGFCDAESSFSIRVAKDNNREHQIKINPIFSIELHKKDINILKMTKEFFGVGHIIERVRKGKPTAIYSVQSITDIHKVIIPHFINYSLITSKSIDFKLFCSAIEIMVCNKKISLEKIKKILSLKASMGKRTGLSSALNSLFPDVIKSDIPLRFTYTNIEAIWLTAFTSGEGMFYIKPVKYKGVLSKYTLVFSLSQHIRDLHLFHVIKRFLRCGNVETKPSRPNEVVYSVYSLNDIIEKIIPFFHRYPILGVKSKDLKDFNQAALILSKGNLSNENLNEITLIKKGMNTKRKW